MTCNRNRLHCQFNHNQRFISRLKLGNLHLHYCAINPCFGGWVSSYIIVCYDYASGEALFPSVCAKSKSGVSNSNCSVDQTRTYKIV